MVKLGNWHDGIGTAAENSPNREAPNRHNKGTRKYKEMISRDVKKTDFWKDLPFTFSKPKKRTHARRDIIHLCDHCSAISVVNKYTAGRGCSKCFKYTSVNEGNTFTTEDELVTELEARSVFIEGGTPSDE